MVQKRETRSRIMSVAMRPSLVEKLQKMAYVKDCTVTTVIHSILEQYVAANPELVEEYDKLTSKSK